MSGAPSQDSCAFCLSARFGEINCVPQGTHHLRLFIGAFNVVRTIRCSPMARPNHTSRTRECSLRGAEPNMGTSARLRALNAGVSCICRTCSWKFRPSLSATCLDFRTTPNHYDAISIKKKGLFGVSLRGQQTRASRVARAMNQNPTITATVLHR